MSLARRIEVPSKSFLFCFASPLLCGVAAMGCSGGDARSNLDESTQNTGVTVGSTEISGGGEQDPSTVKLDAIEGNDSGGESNVQGCDKVDVLFLVDPSPSMDDNMAKLAANAPGFVRAMREELDGVASYHVGIVNTGYAEYVYHDDRFAPCNERGALVTHEIKSGVECGPFADGLRYMTEADDLETMFPCALLHDGTGTTNEQHALHLEAALSEQLAAPGACNEGFLRNKDGLLVIVIITDEDDGYSNGDPRPEGSPGDPADWVAPVVAAKGGREENVVVLTLSWSPPGTDNACGPSRNGERGAYRLIEFTSMFSNGKLGDVCADDYEPFFKDAVNVVNVACEEFVAQ